MKTQVFDQKWFIAQFGKRPTQKQSWDLDREIKDSEYKTALLRKELRDLENYHIRQDTALKTYVNTIYNLKNKKLRGL